MTFPFSRRTFLQAAGLASGAALLPFGRPLPVFGQSAPAMLRAEDLVDTPDTFRAGSGAGLRLYAAPDGEGVLSATGPARAFTSAVLAASFPFSHLGLHWVARTPAGTALTFAVRTSADGVTWTHWQAVHQERTAGESPAGDAFGSLLAGHGARFVQYRTVFHTAGGRSPELRQVTATVIDSPVAQSTLRLPQVPVRDATTGRTLGVTPREWWGADEALRYDDSGAKVWNEMFVPVKKLVVHHTATRNDYATPADAAAEVRAIYYYHAVTQGWGDIGYNALVDKFGNIYEGRHGRGDGPGREILSDDVVAAHDFAHNYGSSGVALLGDATAPDWPMMQPAGPMWENLVAYTTFESVRQFVRPLDAVAGAATEQPAASDFLRSDNNWTLRMKNVSGHRETFPTTCPGDPVMALLDTLRATIQTNIATDAPTVTVSGPGRLASIGGASVLPFTWQVAGLPAGWAVAGYEYSVEGWTKPAGQDDIIYWSGFAPRPQPPQIWGEMDASFTQGNFPLERGGHYTLHVRAWLRPPGQADLVSAPFAGRHTYFVVGPATPPAGTGIESTPAG